MNFYKVLKFVISVFVILSTIIMLKDQLKVVAINYLPFKLKSVIKVLIKDFDKVIYLEEIFIGQRIRDLIFFDNKIILALENKGEKGILSK